MCCCQMMAFIEIVAIPLGDTCLDTAFELKENSSSI